MSIQYQYFPKNEVVPQHLSSVIDVFRKHESQIDSTKFKHNSNTVLDIVSSDMTSIGYDVETGKTSDKKIKIPVVYGLNGVPDLWFEVDGLNRDTDTILEVEAGRAITNYQALKDLCEAMFMGKSYLVIAVRNIYNKSKDFERLVRFINSMYVSNNVQHKLKGILIIGY